MQSSKIKRTASTDQFLFTPQDLADLARFSLSTIYEKMACGEIVSFKDGASRRITKAEALRWIESLEKRAA